MWPALAVMALGGLTAVAAWQSWWPFGGSTGPPAKKDWILVAEFDGPPGDSALAPAVRSLLSAALDQSRIVATVPQDQIARALRLAGKSPGMRVDATLARELAYRSAVRAVLEGTIGRLGKGYTIVLRVVDADTSRVVLTASATAKNEDGLIPALGGMAKELRRGLGENRRALAATRPMMLLATPSFEAYRFFAEAEGRYGTQIGNREMLRDLRAAIALDPEFAAAWYRMAFLYVNLGYADSARTCVANALRWPERLSFLQRQRIETVLATLDGDDARELAAFDRILAEDPTNTSALWNSNDVLVRLGRVEEALARTRKGMALSPFGSGRVARVNEVDDLTRLGRFDEARESNRQQTDIFRLPLLVNIECASGRFALAESIAAANQFTPGLVDDWPDGLSVHLARARYGRGAVDAAAAAYGVAVERCEQAHDVVGADDDRRQWFELAVVSDGVLPFPPVAARGDTTVRLLLLRGFMAAEGRDTTAARRWLVAARARPPAEVAHTGIEPALLEARVAAVTGRPAEAVRLLRPIAAPFRGRGASIGWPAWWMADLFEAMAQPDSAAAYLERVGTVQFGAMEGVEGPYLHRRLALLYAKLGRVADAERHLAAAERAWDRPDPAVRRMLDEARAAVRAARGLAQPPT